MRAFPGQAVCLSDLHIQFFEPVEQLIVLGRKIFRGLDPPAQGEHLPVGAGDHIGTAAEPFRDLLLIGNAALVFHLMFKAGPKVHGDRADLHLGIYLLAVFRKEYGDADDQCRLLYPFGLGSLI